MFFFFFNYYLVAFPPSVSCRLTEKAAFLMPVTASPLHHQCLTLTLALIFSQLPHPECWMPRLPLEAPPVASGLLCLLGSWCSLGSRVYVVTLFVSWRSCSFCVHAASHSRGAILWSFGSCCGISTVPFLFLFPPYVAQTFLILSTQTDFIRQVDVSPASQPLLSLLLAFFSFPFSPPLIGFSQPVLLCESRQNETLAGEREKKKILCPITFPCHWDKIDEMLCLASDLSPDSQMGVERSPCQNWE